MIQRGKMLRSQKLFGRCRVPGHGAKCGPSREIQSTPLTRAADKRLAQHNDDFTGIGAGSSNIDDMTSPLAKYILARAEADFAKFKAAW